MFDMVLFLIQVTLVSAMIVNPSLYLIHRFQDYVMDRAFPNPADDTFWKYTTRIYFICALALFAVYLYR